MCDVIELSVTVDVELSGSLRELLRRLKGDVV